MEICLALFLPLGKLWQVEYNTNYLIYQLIGC